MKESDVKYYHKPVSILVNILSLPILLCYVILTVLIIPFKVILDYKDSLLYDYNLYLLRKTDEAKEIKNPEMRRRLRFKD